MDFTDGMLIFIASLVVFEGGSIAFAWWKRRREERNNKRGTSE